MEQVKPDVLGGGLKVLPGLEWELAPEGVDHFDSDADVTEEFAAEFAGNLESRLWRAHFPELAAVVDENSREQEITVESRISGAKSIGAPEHLRSVAKQASTEGVMVVARGRGSTEACSKLGDECLCQGAKPWIRKAADLPTSQFEIG